MSLTPTAASKAVRLARHNLERPTLILSVSSADLTTLAIPESDLTQLKTQNELAAAWSALVPTFPKEHVHVLPSIEHAVNVVRALVTDPAILLLFPFFAAFVN